MFGIAALLALGSHAVDAVAQEDGVTRKLRWVNGDELTGQIAGATGSHLVWRCEALAQDISIDYRTLAAVDYIEENPVTDLDATFMVAMVNGDMISGDLLQIDAKQLVLSSPRHGEITIDRKWVDRLIRADHSAPIDLTATRGRGWTTVDPSWQEQNPDRYHWDFEEPGEAFTDSPGARLFFEAKLPEFADVELILESSKRPSFSLAMGELSKLQARTGNLEFETWGDELIVQADSAAAEFTPLMRLKPESRTVHLRAFWDRRSGTLTVYDRSGEVLADVELKAIGEQMDGGILVENKGTDLTINMLRVSPWQGGLPTPPKAVGAEETEAQLRVRTIDGHEYAGQIEGTNDEGQLVITPVGGDTVSIKVDQLAEVLSSRHTVSEPARDTCEFRYYDGTLIHGRLLSIVNNMAEVGVPFSSDPLQADLAGLRMITFAEIAPEYVESSEHVLEYNGMTLRGALAPAATKLGWRLVGAEEVIPLQLDRPLRIRRVQPATDSQTSQTEHRGALYLANGDQLPCRVESVDAEFVTVATGFSPTSKIPVKDVKAIEFGASRPDEIIGFSHKRWNISNNQAKATQRSDNEIVFLGPASVSHPELLDSGHCEFVVTWPESPQAYLMLMLSSNQQSIPGPVVPRQRVIQQSMAYIMHSNGKLMVHVRTGNAGHQANIEPDDDEPQSVRVRIQQVGDELKLFANDQEAGTLAVLDESSRWNGLTLTAQPINPRNNNRKQQGNRVPLFTISEMRAGQVAGLFASMHISETSRKHAMTVPRSRRHNPPSHLLVSQTGDLLRGELLSLNQTDVRFRSLFDEVSIPLDRLSGIIWLEKPQLAEDDAADDSGESELVDESTDEPKADTGSSEPTLRGENLVQAVFPDGITLQIDVTAVEGSELVGQHDVFGECRLSLERVNELRTGAVTEQMQEVVFADWMLVPAREPVIPDPNAPESFGTYSTLIGEQAEDFTLEQLDGEAFQLSQHQGKVIVLDFWATWCGPCIRSIPHLIETTTSYSPDDVLFVGVNHQESATIIQKVLDDHDWGFTVAMDRDGEISRKYLVEGFPQTVVIGRDGRIAHVRLGFSPNLQTELAELIDSLLSDRDDSTE